MFNPRVSPDYRWVRVSTRPLYQLARKQGMGARMRELIGLLPFRRDDGLSRFSFERSLAELGVPATDMSPEDELVQLLNEAAEIEQGLMLQYLYAAYSLKVLIAAGAVRLIAIEEMGHFVTVQNLLAACGSAPSFGRGRWGQGNGFRPFPFRLEAASVGSLAKYAVAEMPDPALVPPDVKPDLPDLIAQADNSAGEPVEGHRVGLLYAKIYWLLRQNDDPLPDPTKEPWVGFPVADMAANADLRGRHVRDGFVIDARDVSAMPEQWRGNYTSVIVDPISGRDSALGAIAEIAAQGEGFGNVAQSHFGRFVEAWRLAKASNDLALPVAVNPFYAGNEGAPGDEITSADGRLFALMADKVYELVLLCTAAHLLLPKTTTPEIRAKPAKAAIVAMRDCLSVLAGTLSSIAVSDQSQGKVCGLPFTAPSTPLAPDLQKVAGRARDVMAEVHQVISEVDQSNASSTLKITAASIGDTLDDPIKPLLDSLPA
ncbi:hypothetical protein ABIB90_007695 [Bradyrhizobium sp. JR4.1]|uniref:ferritin-like domain-containing protein n=1 Tax=Bradyrhizobium sp. JR4.1 TaxID=3156372 RepID=UPI0033918C4C